MIALNKTAKEALKNAELRQKNGANISSETRTMLKHCATEVIEATESFTELCLSFQNFSDFCKHKKHFESELADIVCCVLIIAAKEGIDIEKAINDCIEKNRKRAEGKGDKA